MMMMIHNDGMGVKIGKRPSLYSDKHGGAKVNKSSTKISFHTIVQDVSSYLMY